MWAYLKSYLSLDKRLEKDPTDTRCTVYGTGTDTGAGTGTYTDNDTDTRYGTGVLILILVVKGIFLSFNLKSRIKSQRSNGALAVDVLHEAMFLL